MMALRLLAAGTVAVVVLGGASVAETQPLKVATNAVSGVAAPTTTTWVDHGSQVDGACVNSAPVLSLAPGQRSVSADVVAADPATCDVTWQIGAPSTSIPSAARPADGTSAQSPATVVTAPAAATVSPATTYSASGYERAWFNDAPGLELNEVKSNLSFSYNRSCVTSSSGSGYWWWRSGSGWEPPTNKGSWIATSCNNSKVWSQADYKNTGFCWPYTSNTHYRGVSVQGRYDGYLFGWVDSWSWNACLPFSFHSQLVRVTG